jgi:hypothetical protein
MATITFEVVTFLEYAPFPALLPFFKSILEVVLRGYSAPPAILPRSPQLCQNGGLLVWPSVVVTEKSQRRPSQATAVPVPEIMDTTSYVHFLLAIYHFRDEGTHENWHNTFRNNSPRCYSVHYFKPAISLETSLWAALMCLECICGGLPPHNYNCPYEG